MKKIGLIITIVLFYSMIIGYGIIGIPYIYKQDQSIGLILLITVLIGLVLWTKISLKLIKEIRRKIKFLWLK